MMTTSEPHGCLPQARLSSKYDSHVLTQSSQQPNERRAIVFPILQMRKHQHREVKQLAQGHRAFQWQSQESTNPRPSDIRAHAVSPGQQLPHKLVNDGAESRPGQPDSRAHDLSTTKGWG